MASQETRDVLMGVSRLANGRTLTREETLNVCIL